MLTISQSILVMLRILPQNNNINIHANNYIFSDGKQSGERTRSSYSKFKPGFGREFSRRRISETRYKEGFQVKCGEAENGDGDQHVDGEVQIMPKMQPKVDRPGNLPAKWTSLFGVKPSSKSSFPPIKIVSILEKGLCMIVIPDELVDHSIASMASTLVGKFMGQRPNIDVVRSFTLKKWHLKGQVSVTAMEKGFLSFDFTYNEDMTNILCEGPWNIGQETLVLQKWSSKLNLNESFF